jgi:hypothetical protein
MVLIAGCDAGHGVLPDHHTRVVSRQDRVANRPGRTWPAVQKLGRFVDILEPQTARAVAVDDQDVFNAGIEQTVDGRVDFGGRQALGMIVVTPGIARLIFERNNARDTFDIGSNNNAFHTGFLAKVRNGR